MPTPDERAKPVWQDAWREFQDPYLHPDAEKFPSPFESFVAGFTAALSVAERQRDEAEAVIEKALAEIVSEFAVDHRGHNVEFCSGELSFVTREARDLHRILASYRRNHTGGNPE